MARFLGESNLLPRQMPTGDLRAPHADGTALFVRPMNGAIGARRIAVRAAPRSWQLQVPGLPKPEAAEQRMTGRVRAAAPSSAIVIRTELEIWGRADAAGTVDSGEPAPEAAQFSAGARWPPPAGAAADSRLLPAIMRLPLSARLAWLAAGARALAVLGVGVPAAALAWFLWQSIA